MLDALAEEAAAKGVRLTSEQLAQLEPEEDVIVRRHVSDSIALGAALRERELLRPDANVIDVGAGAGFPGIPIKVIWPSIVLTTFDATAKKTAFLTAVTDALGLEGVTVRTGRAEQLAHEPALREAFDLVLARAVAPLPTLLELALPFVRACWRPPRCAQGIARGG
jgi:16S rRNA (guanine527-N7)-methyltransferase